MLTTRLLASIVAAGLALCAPAALAGDGAITIAYALANAKAFEGKRITVNAYVTIQLEETQVCDDAKPKPFYHHCLWFAFDDGPANTPADMERYNNRERYWQAVNKKRVRISGIFTSAENGHLGIWPAGMRAPRLESR